MGTVDRRDFILSLAAVTAGGHAAAQSAPGTTILVLGDSMSAEYGLARGTGWVALLAQHRPSVVVIELGGNDALRGLPLQSTEANLTAMAQAARKAGARVLLVGMQVPPNYGADYTRRFAALFHTVAQAQKAALVPFLLQGVADGPEPTKLFQADRIHPTAQAQPTMLENVWPALKKLL